MSITARSQTDAKAGAGTDSVLETQAPAFSTEQAEAIAGRSFDIHASAHALGSERDQNFRLHAKDGSEWVLKIANPAENPALLDMQTQAMLHIAQVDPSLAIPRVKATPDGALFHEIEAAAIKAKIHPLPSASYLKTSGDSDMLGTSGEMAERTKAPVSKTGIRVTVSWVRIPLSPPGQARNRSLPLN